MHIRSASRISATFKGARCGLRKRGAFQLMNLGKGEYRMLTTDLSEKYVRINLGE